MVLRANPGMLRVHEIASEVAGGVIEQVRTFPLSERLNLGDQLVRAAVSVPANIAEGCGRGSAQEVLTLLHVAGRSGLGHRETMRSLENKIALVLKMLVRLYDRPPPDR